MNFDLNRRILKAVVWQISIYLTSNGNVPTIEKSENTFMDHLVRNMYSADKKASASETVIAGSNNQCPCNSAVSCITPFRNHTFIS